MPTDIIEMLWGCLICDHENLGRFKVCQNCGKPRSEDSPEWMPDDISPMAAVKDAKLLGKFKGGPDWQCLFCQSSQFRADGNCAQCGAEQTRSTDKAATIRGTSTQDRGAGRVTIVELSEDAKERLTVRGTFPPVHKDIPKPRPKWSESKKTVVGIVAAILGVVVFLLYLGLRTRVVNATVHQTHWERTVSVSRYQIWTREGWNTDTGAFDTKDLGPRIHHYDHVLVGSHQEAYQERYACGEDCRTIKGSCYTTSRSCTSNKNGSATCTGGDRVCSSDTQSCSTRYCNRTAYRTVNDYEDQPRYQEWYRWSVWDWGHNRTIKVDGEKDPHWPDQSLVQLSMNLKTGEQEREEGRTENYLVTFAYKDERFEYKPNTEQEFSTFRIGEPHKLKVGTFHGVEVLTDK